MAVFMSKSALEYVKNLRKVKKVRVFKHNSTERIRSFKNTTISLSMIDLLCKVVLIPTQNLYYLSFNFITTIFTPKIRNT